MTLSNTCRETIISYDSYVDREKVHRGPVAPLGPSQEARGSPPGTTTFRTPPRASKPKTCNRRRRPETFHHKGEGGGTQGKVKSDEVCSGEEEHRVDGSRPSTRLLSQSKQLGGCTVRTPGPSVD